MRWYFNNGRWENGAGVPLKVAPIQTHLEKSVPWDVSAEAWKEYADQGHGSQSHERICERAGFGAAELAILLYERIKRLERSSQKAGELCVDEGCPQHGTEHVCVDGSEQTRWVPSSNENSELIDRVCRGVASVQEGQQLREYIASLQHE